MAGFNKMFIMLPLMFAVRKIDGEDPVVVQWLRIAYFSVQFIMSSIAIYVYFQALSAKKNNNMDKIVYVPPPAQPFADPNAKKKYTEVVFSAHVAAQAQSLLTSTLFGALLTTGLHFWKGMVIGLAMQTVMGPLNLYDNVLAQYVLFKGGITNLSPDEKIFGEKAANELTSQDEIVDQQGNAVVVKRVAPSSTSASSASSASNNSNDKSSSSNNNLEDLLLDTWDAGAQADLTNLLSVLNAKNIDFKTSENQWTALMVLAGLAGAKGTVSAIKHVKSLGAKLDATDAEGWTALHWAAFHGSVGGAKALVDDGLESIKDKEGKVALDYAKSEGNADVVKVLEAFQKDK